MNKVTEEKIYDYALPSMTLYPFSKAKLRPCPHLPTRAITNLNEANEIVNRIQFIRVREFPEMFAITFSKTQY